MPRKWLKISWGRLKIQKLKFDSILLIDESHVDKENAIWGRKVQNHILMDSIEFIEGLIKFIEGLIARKIGSEVNLGFNLEKLKCWDQIIIF